MVVELCSACEAVETESQNEEYQDTEEYRTVRGYENYEVSNLGNVRETKTGIILETFTRDKSIMPRVRLYKNGESSDVFNYKLVLEAFVDNNPNPDLFVIVDRISGSDLVRVLM